MKEIIFIIATFFTVHTWAEISVQHAKSKNCANVTRINVTVNLLDKGCMKKSADNASEPIGSKTDIVVENVEMAEYALCLLKKASIINQQGKVNANFDISKIVQHLYKKTDEKGLGLVFIIKSVKGCRDLSGADEFKTAANIMKCLLENQETILWCDHQYN